MIQAVVSLRRRSLGDEECWPIPALRQRRCESLTALDLRSNNICGEGGAAEALSAAVSGTRSLVKVLLKDNPIWHTTAQQINGMAAINFLQEEPEARHGEGGEWLRSLSDRPWRCVVHLW